LNNANKFIKILENEDGDLIGSLTENINTLCDSTKAIFDEIIKEKQLELICSLVDCESPIEQIMALRLSQYENSYHAVNDRLCNGIDLIEVHRQYVIKNKNSNYRADFLITIWDELLKEGYSFVIECDGHDFHEKTKEQAQKDKQRDREILASGMYVMRYTGSEIFNNENIAFEVFNNIKSIIFNRRKQRQ